MYYDAREVCECLRVRACACVFACACMHAQVLRGMRLLASGLRNAADENAPGTMRLIAAPTTQTYRAVHQSRASTAAPARRSYLFCARLMPINRNTLIA